MKLPEFTASASLGESNSNPYWTVATGTPLAPSVYPAFRRGCMAKCLDQQAGDPYAYQNCHSVASGIRGKLAGSSKSRT